MTRSYQTKLDRKKSKNVYVIREANYQTNDHTPQEKGNDGEQITTNHNSATGRQCSLNISKEIDHETNKEN